MEKFRLKGKSLKGKNRVKEHGEIWELISRRDRVLFSSEAGPWLLVTPISVEPILEPKRADRWVKEKDDPDFEVSLYEPLSLPRLCPTKAEDPDPNFKHCFFENAICIHCGFNPFEEKV